MVAHGGNFHDKQLSSDAQQLLNQFEAESLYPADGQNIIPYWSCSAASQTEPIRHGKFSRHGRKIRPCHDNGTHTHTRARPYNYSVYQGKLLVDLFQYIHGCAFKLQKNPLSLPHVGISFHMFLFCDKRISESRYARYFCPTHSWKLHCQMVLYFYDSLQYENCCPDNIKHRAGYTENCVLLGIVMTLHDRGMTL